LGASSRTSAPGATAFTGGGALSGFTGPLGGAPGNPLDQAGSYGVTSDELPRERFPRFASGGAGAFPGTVNPYGPYAGSYMAAAVHTDDGYKRLSRTVDLTGTTAADRKSAV